jgi:hypothetical protein
MSEAEKTTDLRPQNFGKYCLLSFAFWMIIEYITVWGIQNRVAEWISYMPFIFIYYLGIILLFGALLYKKNLPEKNIFIIMVVIMYPFEIILYSNSLLLSPVWFLPHSLQLISIWGFLVFTPAWVLDKNLKNHKGMLGFNLIWIPLGFILAILIG